jgi:hypothetical protein
VIWISFHYLWLHHRDFPGRQLILNLLNIFHYFLLGLTLHLYKPKPNPVVDGKHH